MPDPRAPSMVPPSSSSWAPVGLAGQSDLFGPGSIQQSPVRHTEPTSKAGQGFSVRLIIVTHLQALCCHQNSLISLAHLNVSGCTLILGMAAAHTGSSTSVHTPAPPHTPPTGTHSTWTPHRWPHLYTMRTHMHTQNVAHTHTYTHTTTDLYMHMTLVSTQLHLPGLHPQST